MLSGVLLPTGCKNERGRQYGKVSASEHVNCIIGHIFPPPLLRLGLRKEGRKAAGTWHDIIIAHEIVLIYILSECNTEIPFWSLVGFTELNVPDRIRSHNLFIFTTASALQLHLLLVHWMQSIDQSQYFQLKKEVFVGDGSQGSFGLFEYCKSRLVFGIYDNCSRDENGMMKRHIYNRIDPRRILLPVIPNH